MFGCANTDGTTLDVSQREALRQGPAVVVSASHSVAYLVDRLARDLVEHRAVLPREASASTWAPDASVVLDLQTADRIVLNGGGLEAWVKTVSLPSDKRVNLAQGLRLIEEEGAVHSHGKGGEHSHHEIDPRVWTDPLAYRAQAVTLHTSLGTLPGIDQATLDANLSALTKDLDALHEQMQTATRDLKGLRLITAQPAFSYLTRQYGLNVSTLSMDPNKPAQDIRSFEEATQHQAFSVLLWNDAPEASVRDTFSGNVRHVVLDDLSAPTAEGYDYMVQARFNAVALAEIIPDLAP